MQKAYLILRSDAQTEDEAIEESDEVKEADNNDKGENDDDNEMPTRSESVGNQAKKKKGFLYKVFGKFTKSKN